MNKLEIAKTAIGFVVGAGASKITHTIIANNVRPERVIDKITVTAGSIAVGMMVADASKSFTAKKIDDIVKSFREMQNSVQKAQQEKQ